MNNNRGCGIAKEIMQEIMVNKDKKVKWRYEIDCFYLLLKIIFYLNHIIKLFYQTYLIYLTT